MTEDFYAKTNSGYIIRGLGAVLHDCLTSDAHFCLEKSGISVCDSDNKNTSLININLPMGNFDTYRCARERTIAVTIKHLHKLLKNVKKKDSITLFIDDKRKPNKLGITVKPVPIAQKSDREETSYITFREVDYQKTDVPEGYHFPKVIASTEYQKMCKKMEIVPGKTITITIQESNYICFYCDGGDIITTEMAFGKLDSNTENVYEENFYASMLKQLIKMPGLSHNMQISAPLDKRFPIKIKMQAGTLGEIEVFLKTQKQVDYESQQQEE